MTGKFVITVTDTAVLVTGPQRRNIEVSPVATRVQAALAKPTAAEARKQAAADKRARQAERQARGMR